VVVYLQLLVLPIHVRLLQRLGQQHFFLHVRGLERERRQETVLEKEVIFGRRELSEAHRDVIQRLITDPLVGIDHMRRYLFDDSDGSIFPDGEILYGVNKSNSDLIESFVDTEIKSI
jgi:hypothetical protein